MKTSANKRSFFYHFPGLILKISIHTTFLLKTMKTTISPKAPYHENKKAEAKERIH